MERHGGSASAPLLWALALLLRLLPLAGLHFAAPFGQGMLLQRGQPLATWGGGAAPGSEVTVTLTLPGKTVVAKGAADSSGNWTVFLPAVPAAPTAVLMASSADGNSNASLTDVAVGELLLCGGQVCHAEYQQKCCRPGWCPYTWGPAVWLTCLSLSLDLSLPRRATWDLVCAPCSPGRRQRSRRWTHCLRYAHSSGLAVVPVGAAAARPVLAERVRPLTPPGLHPTLVSAARSPHLTEFTALTQACAVCLCSKRRNVQCSLPPHGSGTVPIDE